MAKHRKTRRIRRHYGDGPSGLSFGKLVLAVAVGQVAYNWLSALLPAPLLGPTSALSPYATPPYNGYLRRGGLR
ncbi:MAG: hypothetical protein ACYC6M_03115 [Terriglobales bacterium]